MKEFVEFAKDKLMKYYENKYKIKTLASQEELNYTIKINFVVKYIKIQNK